MSFVIRRHDHSRIRGGHFARHRALAEIGRTIDLVTSSGEFGRTARIGRARFGGFGASAVGASIGLGSGAFNNGAHAAAARKGVDATH